MCDSFFNNFVLITQHRSEYVLPEFLTVTLLGNSDTLMLDRSTAEPPQNGTVRYELKNADGKPQMRNLGFTFY